MPFFDRFKKQQEVQRPTVNAPDAVVISSDNALPPSMDGEVKPPVVEEEEVYEDDEEEDNSKNENKEDEEDEEDEEDNEDDSDEKLKKLEEQIAETKKEIEEAKRLKQEKRERQLRETSLQGNQDEPTYVPIYLTEAELLREIIKKLDRLELWARDITTYINSKGDKI